MTTGTQKRPAPLGGRATAEGSSRFAARHAAPYHDDFFRPLGREGVRASSIGLGTYLGECTAADDGQYARTVRAALEHGINLLDTAINYRCQRSERTIGQALTRALHDGIASRDEVIVCTKGGYIPLDGVAPDSREDYWAYLTREYFERGVMTPADVVAGAHCLAPGYLADQIGRSRANLGIATIDVYYVHNPEQQLDAIPPDALRDRLRAAFALLEERCASGEIAQYGCSTWNGFRVPPDARGHLSLAELVGLAREVGGDGHHFRVVQLPVNLAFTEAVRAPTQQLGNGRAVTLLQAATELGVAVVASAALLQGSLRTGLPAQLRDAIPGLRSDAQRAIAFVRSLPVVTAALVGMKTIAHLEENLGAGVRA
ncbi:MAG TPA: aldo/keto reductase [Gemmatimonadaceae bacterium]|nr:aldo/keto reductase [Gemmatimonadaceae bacterium]